MKKVKRLRVACSCDPRFGGSGRCSRKSHDVRVYFQSGPLCVAPGRDCDRDWMVYHKPSGFAYPHDFASKTAALKAMRKLLKIAGVKWWSSTDFKAMAADKKVVKKFMKAYPRRVRNFA